MKLSSIVLGLIVLFFAGCNSENGGFQGKIPFGRSNPNELYTAGDSHKALAVLDNKARLSSEDRALRDDCIWTLYEQHRFSNPDSAYSYLQRATPDGPLWNIFKVELGHESEFYIDPERFNLCWGSYSLSQARMLTRQSFPIRRIPDSFYLEGTGPYLLACALSGDELSRNMLAASVASIGNYYPDGPDEFKFQEWMTLWERSLDSYAAALMDSNLFCIDAGWFECGDYNMNTGSFPVDAKSNAVPIMSRDELAPRGWDISSILSKEERIVRRVLLDLSGQGINLARLAIPPETAETLTRFWRENADRPRTIRYWFVFSPIGAATKDVYRVRIERGGISEDRVRRKHRETTIRANVAAVFVTINGDKLFPTCTMVRTEDKSLARALSASRWHGSNSEQVIKVLFPPESEEQSGTRDKDSNTTGQHSTASGHTTIPYRFNWGQFSDSPTRKDLIAAEYVPREWHRPDYLDGAQLYDLGYKILLDAAQERKNPFIPQSMEGDEFASENATRAYKEWYEYYRGLMNAGRHFVFIPTSLRVVLGVYNSAKGGVSIVDGSNRPFTWRNIVMPSSEVENYREISHQIQIVNSGSWATWLPMEQPVAKHLVSTWDGNGRPELSVLCLGRIEGASQLSQSERLLRVNARALVYTDMKGNVLGILTPPE